MIKVIVFSSILVLLTSCLRTRSDIGYQRPGYNTPPKKTAYDPNSGYNVPQPVKLPQSENGVSQTAAANSQAYGSQLNTKDVARLQINIQELNDQIRTLNGRVEVIEKQLMDSQAAGGQVNLDAKLKNYELALSDLQTQVQALRSGRTAVGTNQPQKITTLKLNAFGRAEALFREKNWRKAISEYQLYREQYPKGKDYSEATYKIGVCFQELKMKSEAKVFYQEAVSKYPSTKAGKKAKFRLKQL